MGLLPFRFSSTWLELEVFFDVVQKSWNIFIQGSPSFILEQRLKNVKKELKSWLAQCAYNLGKEKVDHIKILEALQEKMEQGNITRELLI